MRWARAFALFAVLCLAGCDYCKECPTADVDECPDELCGADEPDPTAAPTPEPPSNPVCEGIGDFRDGGGGMLWKPKGDHNPNLVVLLEGKFRVKFDKCTAERPNGDVEELRFTGFSNADAVGARQTWRGSSPGRDYKSRGLLRCREFKQVCRWRIPKDPGRRAD